MGPDLGLRCLTVTLIIINTSDCDELGHVANTKRGQGKDKGNRRDSDDGQETGRRLGLWMNTPVIPQQTRWGGEEQSFIWGEISLISLYPPEVKYRV